MIWSVVLSSAITAGVVSAIVNGLIGWARAAADAKERRNEARRANLRDAVVDFLAADEQRFRVWVHGQSPDQVSDQTDEERATARHNARNAVSRMHLYSTNLHKRAIDVLALDFRSAQREKEVAAFLQAARAELGIDGL